MYDAYDVYVRSFGQFVIKIELSVLCRDKTIINKWGGKLTTLKLKNT